MNHILSPCISDWEMSTEEFFDSGSIYNLPLDSAFSKYDLNASIM